MKTLFKTLLAVIFVLLAAPAFAALNIFACEPEWAALAQELAGDQASIYSATTTMQDPHQIQARPSLIAKARRAQLLVCTGAELEIGWLPLIVRESGNPDLSPGKPGNFETAQFVTLLDIPTRLDRADGDVHAAGNPHIQTDARNFLPIAQALSARMSQIDPANAAMYRSRLQDFTQRWQAALLRWEKQAAPLRGQAVVVQHAGFPYLINWLGLKQAATLEPAPGMEPSVAYLSRVRGELQQHPVRMVIRAAYQSAKPSEWIAGQAHIPAVVLPFSVGGTDAATDLFSLFDDTIQRLLAGLK